MALLESVVGMVELAGPVTLVRTAAVPLLEPSATRLVLLVMSAMLPLPSSYAAVSLVPLSRVLFSPEELSTVLLGLVLLSCEPLLVPKSRS